MQRTVVCTQCDMTLAVPAAAEGQRIQCPGCQSVFSVGPTSSRADDSVNRADGRSFSDNSVLAWACVCIVTLALAGGVGALIWQLTHRPVMEEVPVIAAAGENNPRPPLANEGNVGANTKPQGAEPVANPPVVTKKDAVPAIEKKETKKVEQNQETKPKPEPNTVELDASVKPEVPATEVTQAPPPPTPADDKVKVEGNKKPEKKQEDANPKVIILDANVPASRGVDVTGTTPGVLSPGSPSHAGLVNKVAGRLNANVGAVFDVDAKAALLLLPGGNAKLFDYPTFRPLGSYKLGGGTAYCSAYDKAKGRLYVLSRDAKAKDPTGKPGGSQLVCYDIRGLLDGRLNARAEVTPAKVISLGGFCTNLCLSADGAWLYALDAQGRKIVRVNAAQEKSMPALRCPPSRRIFAWRATARVFYARS